MCLFIQMIMQMKKKSKDTTDQYFDAALGPEAAGRLFLGGVLPELAAPEHAVLAGHGRRT